MINRRESAADSASSSAGKLIRETQDRSLPERIAVIHESGISLENVFVRCHKKLAGRISVEPGGKFSIHDDESLEELSRSTGRFEGTRPLAGPDEETYTVDAIPGNHFARFHRDAEHVEPALFPERRGVAFPARQGSKTAIERRDRQSWAANFRQMYFEKQFFLMGL
jgi:hypothetical protein